MLSLNTYFTFHERNEINFKCSFRTQKWEKSISLYTDAISGALHVKSLNSFLPALYRNRSSAFFATKKYDESLQDALASLRLEPRNPKVDSTINSTIYIKYISFMSLSSLIILR